MKQPESNRRVPGIRRQHRPGRPLPFLLGWTEGGKRKWQSYSTEEERSDAEKKLLEKREEFGKEVLSFDPREWRTWLAFKAKIGEADPMQVAHEWLAGRGGTTSTLTVAEAVTKYLAHRSDGNLSEDTRRHFKKHLQDRFAATHGAMNLHEVAADTIRKWLKSLRHPRTAKPMEPVTLRHHRKDVNTFLEWCVAEGLIMRNPCASVAVPEVIEEDVELMPVADTQRLFELNAGRRVIYRIALEAFGFLRASSAGRISKADINFKTRGLRMPGAQHKSRKTKFRQGHPDNLWAWIEGAPDEVWDMQWWEYRNEKRVAFEVAGLGGSDNRLRKTCLSAHLAWLKNQPLTSYLAQHRHTSTTEIYLGVMDEMDGERHFLTYPTGASCPVPARGQAATLR